MKNFRGHIFNKDARKTYFVMCDLSGALFEGVDCTEANFAGSYQQGCVYADVDLTKCNFEGAYLHSATFVRCKMDNTVFQRASLENSTFIGNVGQFTDFNHAELKDIHFTKNDFVNSFGLVSNLEILKKAGGKIIAYRFEVEDGLSPFHGVRYEVGQIYRCDNLNKNPAIGCAEGLHVATLDWCIACGYADYGVDNAGNPNFSIIEIECDPNDIFVPYEKDRFRVAEFTVLRNVPLTEWWNLNA